MSSHVVIVLREVRERASERLFGEQSFAGATDILVHGWLLGLGGLVARPLARGREASIDLGGIGGAIVLAAAGALFLSCRCDLLLSRSRSAASPPQLAATAQEFFPDAPLLPRAGT